MARINSIVISPPLINSSCAWASDEKQLRELYDSPYTGAVTTRTATPAGFEEDNTHTVAFTSDNITSVNSYGYSPHPLSFYIDVIASIIREDPTSTKPFIISVTSSSPSAIRTMVRDIQTLRRSINDSGVSRIAIELNTSCPNIKNFPPAAYNISTLIPVLQVLSDEFAKDPTLTIGIKLAPFILDSQFHEVISTISSFSLMIDSAQRNPFAFLTCTNTLGNSLVFSSQTVESSSQESEFALPTVLGGLAGEPLHPLALGNVYKFSTLLHDADYECLQDIVLIGVGGVTTPAAVERMKKAGAQVVGCDSFR